MYDGYKNLVDYIKSTDIKDKVKFKFIDIFSEDIEKYPSAYGALQKGYSLPIITVNGNVRFAGGIPLKELYDEVKSFL